MASMYIIIERQWSQDLSIEYSTEDKAIQALTDSLLIDGLCEEDALDCYTADSILEGSEHLLANEDEY